MRTGTPPAPSQPTPQSQSPAACAQERRHLKEALQHLHDADRRTREATKCDDALARANLMWAAEWALKLAEEELHHARTLTGGNATKTGRPTLK